jgi:hypothetical protein
MRRRDLLRGVFSAGAVAAATVAPTQAATVPDRFTAGDVTFRWSGWRTTPGLETPFAFWSARHTAHPNVVVVLFSTIDTDTPDAAQVRRRALQHLEIRLRDDPDVWNDPLLHAPRR